MEKKKNVSFRVSESDFEHIKRVAGQRGLSLSEYIRVCLGIAGSREEGYVIIGDNLITDTQKKLDEICSQLHLKPTGPY